MSKETEEYLNIKDEEIEKELERIHKRYSQNISVNNSSPGTEINLETVIPEYGIELVEKQENDISW